ncbi:hypothetical protein LEMLEM_LOCUS19669 [Lemmus lemmus]
MSTLMITGHDATPEDTLVDWLYLPISSHPLFLEKCLQLIARKN